VKPGSGAHPVVCSVDTGVEGMKLLESEADRSPSSAEVNNWLSLTSAFTLQLHGVDKMKLILILYVLSLIPIMRIEEDVDL
jgi:hypothetical protein